MKDADKLMFRQRLAQFAVILMMCLSVTAPAITLTPALPYFKVEQLMLPVVFCIYAWLLMAGIANTIHSNGMFPIGFLYCISNAISIWYGANILGHSVILRDFYELPKVLLPVAFFTLAYEAELSERSLRRLLVFFSMAILPVCFYAWCQFAGLSFTYKLNSYYSSGGHIDTALEYAHRAYSTMGNPNVLGQLMTWCVILFVLAALFRVGNRHANLVISLACLITLVMTGSRYGLLNVSIGLVFVFGIVSLTRQRRLAQVSLLFLLLPVFFWIYQTVATSNRETLARYQSLQNPLQIDSLRQRLDSVWQEEWGDFLQSPIFGHGPAKTIYSTGFADSEYLGVLREKGLIGLFLFLGYYLYPLYLIRRGQRALRLWPSSMANETPATLMAVHFTMIMGVLALIMNLGMSTFYSPFLQGFLWLWLGIGARAAKFASVRVPRRAVSLTRRAPLLPQKVVLD
jgi:O-antigen ligase